MKVEGVGYNIEGHREAHRGHCGTRVEIILYFIFFEPKVIVNDGRKTLGDVGKACKTLLLRQQGSS